MAKPRCLSDVTVQILWLSRVHIQQSWNAICRNFSYLCVCRPLLGGSDLLSLDILGAAIKLVLNCENWEGLPLVSLIAVSPAAGMIHLI